MEPTNFHTYNEIRTQTSAWSQAIELMQGISVPRVDDYHQVIFTGCGSTYYLSLAAAALYQELTGCLACAVPAGELLLNPRASVGRIDTPPRDLLVAVSRSGTTTETIRAVQQYKADKRGDVVVISNYDEVLSGLADTAVVIDQGQEQSVAQTRSFASMYVAATMLCARIAGRNDLVEAMGRLPEAGNRILAEYEPFAKSIGENLGFDRFYFLGSGSRYGLACEVNLKMKEMTLTHSEPFHFLEFRHGPMSMVSAKAVVLGLLSGQNHSHEMKVLSEMNTLGGTVLGIGESDADVVFKSDVPESGRGVLYLPVLQLMAFYRSLAKGLNPDRPKHLTAVVRLEI